jgi:hypothetical protein
MACGNASRANAGAALQVIKPARDPLSVGAIRLRRRDASIRKRRSSIAAAAKAFRSDNL